VSIQRYVTSHAEGLDEYVEGDLVYYDDHRAEVERLTAREKELEDTLALLKIERAAIWSEVEVQAAEVKRLTRERDYLRRSAIRQTMRAPGGFNEEQAAYIVDRALADLAAREEAT
jgi:hypothetical protein